MVTPSIPDIDWQHIFHAYGPAVDTPAALARLASDSDEDFAAGMEHLDAAILHQGTIYPATPVVVRWVCALLAPEPHPSVDEDRARELISWLREAGLSLEEVLESYELGTIEEGAKISSEERADFERVLDECAADVDEDGDMDEAWLEHPGNDAAMTQAVLDLRECRDLVNGTLEPVRERVPGMREALEEWGDALWD